MRRGLGQRAGGRRSTRARIILAVIIALAVGWATVANQGVLHGWLAWIVSAILGLGVLGAIVGPNLLSRGGSGAATDLSLAQVTDRLAVAVEKQWQDEAAWQRLNDPQPLPIAWRPADLDLVEPWDNLAITARGWPGGLQVDPARWAASPAELAGADNDLADRLTRIPTGRLIVLGEPGAGKTMLLVRLVLDLLAKRAPGDPVPVLVSLAGWNPADEDEDLAAWLTRRLILNYQGLDDPAPPGAGAVSRARALLDQRLLLPILDGLDELPEALWSRAVTRLNDWLPPRQGLIVASRTAAYRLATTPADPEGALPVRVWGTAGIILRPVTPEAVRAYLRRDAGSEPAAARWDPVLATLGTSAPVAQAFRSPLLVSLARTIYNPRPDQHTGPLPDPAKLCNTTRMPTCEAIQAHLFDEFVPAAYRPHPDPARNPSWSAAQAKAWLVFLARHLDHDRNGTTDIAWWELYRAISPSSLWLAVALAVGLAVGLPVGLAFGPVFGLAAGLPVGLMGGLVSELVLESPQEKVTPARALRWSKTGLTIGLPVGLPFGLLVGLAAGLAFGLPVGLAVGLVFALALGLAVGLALGLERTPVDLPTAADPRAVLARDRRAFLTAFLTNGLTGGLLLGLVGGLAFGFVGGLVSGFVAGGLVAGGLATGLILGLMFGLASGFTGTAWGRFAITRCRLALRGRLPWPLMTFLADAHQRGVLRQPGAVYQFRHAELQHRLATPPLRR
jgi:hypothetical protein